MPSVVEKPVNVQSSVSLSSRSPPPPSRGFRHPCRARSPGRLSKCTFQYVLIYSPHTTQYRRTFTNHTPYMISRSPRSQARLLKTQFLTFHNLPHISALTFVRYVHHHLHTYPGRLHLRQCETHSSGLPYLKSIKKRVSGHRRRSLGACMRLADKGGRSV